LEELGIPELDSQQIEELCIIVEETARKYILSRVPLKRIEELTISVETRGTKRVTLTVDVDISLSPLMKSFEVKELADQAVRESFTAAENHLGELKCASNK
jgi:hypothetical protein